MSNPYAPPGVAVRDVDSGEPAPLASRWRRLGGAAIDAAILLLAWIVLAWFLYAVVGVDLFTDEETSWTQALWQVDIPGTVSYIAIFLLVQGPSLWLRSQTLGKMIVGTRIVDQAGVRAGMGRILLRRELPFQLVTAWGVGLFVPLLDIPLIFRRDRRCLHDHLAGTRVVLVR